MRFAVALSIILPAIATALPARAADARLESILQRAREASGAPYRHHVVSVSHETLQGRIFEVTTETEGAKFRVRRCTGGLCSGSFFDGERGYDTTFNDTPVPRSSRTDVRDATLRAIESYAFTSAAFRAAGGEVVERPPLVRDGKRYLRVAVALPHGPYYDALLDPQSALVSAIVSDDATLALEFGDVRRVDGVALPFSIAHARGTLQTFERRTLVGGPLGLPAGIEPAIVPEAAALAMTPESLAGGQPIVPCSLGGRAVTCLLDTGNSGLSLSLELAETLGLEPRDGVLEVSGVGAYVTGMVTAPRLSVGPATYPMARYAVLHDLHPYGYDVILGADAFARVRLTLDYGKREVRFARSDGAAAGGVALTFANFVPVVNVELGDVGAPLAIDTGDESSINLGADFYAEHPRLFRPSAARAVAGIGGTSEEILGVLPVIRLGDYEIERPVIGATRGLAPTAQGHIGSGLLRHFAVTFDYARSRIELLPRAGDPAVRPAEAARATPTAGK